MSGQLLPGKSPPGQLPVGQLPRASIRIREWGGHIANGLYEMGEKNPVRKAHRARPLRVGCRGRAPAGGPGGGAPVSSGSYGNNGPSRWLLGVIETNVKVSLTEPLIKVVRTYIGGEGENNL